MLRFGLENAFSPISAVDSHGSQLCLATITKPASSFVAWDPYPNHTVAAVKLAFDSIAAEFMGGKIGLDAFEDLVSSLSSVLRAMPYGSKFIEVVQEAIERAYQESTGKYSAD